jgi:hypothetical protein
VICGTLTIRNWGSKCGHLLFPDHCQLPLPSSVLRMIVALLQSSKYGRAHFSCFLYPASCPGGQLTATDSK